MTFWQDARPATPRFRRPATPPARSPARGAGGGAGGDGRCSSRSRSASPARAARDAGRRPRPRRPRPSTAARPGPRGSSRPLVAASARRAADAARATARRRGRRSAGLTVTAIGARDGAARWQVDVPAPADGRADAATPCSSPPTTAFVALDRATGARGGGPDRPSRPDRRARRPATRRRRSRSVATEQGGLVGLDVAAGRPAGRSGSPGRSAARPWSIRRRARRRGLAGRRRPPSSRSSTARPGRCAGSEPSAALSRRAGARPVGRRRGRARGRATAGTPARCEAFDLADGVPRWQTQVRGVVPSRIWARSSTARDLVRRRPARHGDPPRPRHRAEALARPPPAGSTTQARPIRVGRRDPGRATTPARSSPLDRRDRARSGPAAVAGRGAGGRWSRSRGAGRARASGWSAGAGARRRSAAARHAPQRPGSRRMTARLHCPPTRASAPGISHARHSKVAPVSGAGGAARAEVINRGKELPRGCRHHEAAAGGRSPLRPPDAPLEPEDEAVHLR